MNLNPPTMDSHPEQRNARLNPRYAVSLSVKITVTRQGQKRRLHGRTIEVGLGGIACFAPLELLLGERAELEVIFPYQQKKLQVEAVVRNRHGNRYGFKFYSLAENQKEQITRICRALALLNKDAVSRR